MPKRTLTEDWARKVAKQLDGTAECLTYPHLWIVDVGCLRFEWDGGLNFLVASSDLVQADYFKGCLEVASKARWAS